MYTGNTTFKKNNIYTNLIQENGSNIQYKPSTIIASDFNEIGLDSYIGNNINIVADSQSVTVALFTDNMVEFKYGPASGFKQLSNIKKIFSKQLNTQEQEIIKNIILGNIILKENIVYVENFNEVE